MQPGAFQAPAFRVNNLRGEGDNSMTNTADDLHLIFDEAFKLAVREYRSIYEPLGYPEVDETLHGIEGHDNLGITHLELFHTNPLTEEFFVIAEVKVQDHTVISMQVRDHRVPVLVPKEIPTMQIGSGCHVHLRADELPAKGKLIVALSKHYAAVVDGVLHDKYDCTRNGTRVRLSILVKPDDIRGVKIRTGDDEYLIVE